MRRFLAVLLGLVCGGAALAGSVVVPTEFRAVVSEATLIVRGHVTDIRAVVMPGVGIDSIATVAVDGVVKGQAGGFLSVRVPGGEDGRYRFVMVGAPTFHVGERAVFFLKPGADNTLRPVGLTMGIYQIHADPQTGQAVVDPPLVAGRTASTGPVVRGDARRRPMPVQEFESLVRLLLAAPQAVPRGGGVR
jgi:hypothetical protein